METSRSDELIPDKHEMLNGWIKVLVGRVVKLTEEVVELKEIATQMGYEIEDAKAEDGTTTE